MQRIALFGGTFDPIHNGHVQMALEFAKRLCLDKVLLMPTFVPPHKLKSDMAPPEDRLEMCRLAAEQFSALDCSDLEIQRGGASFTADTLASLQRQYPDAEWFLIVGADMFVTLATWYRFEDIAASATLCAAPREPITIEEMKEYAVRLEQLGARCFVEPMQIQTVSSTQIRKYLRQGKSIAELVPKAVMKYISRQGLYTCAENMDVIPMDEQFIEIIKTRLKPKRFQHSLAVAEEAERLAIKYGVNPQKARTAGILHDILKNTDDDVLLQMCAEFDIILDSVEKSSKKLWHARIGAAFIENVLGLHDPEILSAIRYHTTARAGMTKFEKILYLADFTSADRDYHDVDIMRKLVDTQLEAAMEYALSYTISELVEKRQAIHPDTFYAYNECMTHRQIQD